MKRLLPLLFVLVVPDAAANSGRDRRLAAGEVLVTTVALPSSDVPRAEARAVVDAPPAAVWRVVSDCGRFSETMPRVKASRLVRRRGDRYWCETTIGLPFPLDDLSSVTEGVHVTGPPRWSRRWKLVSGNYRRNEGSWELEAFGPGGRRTLVTYRIHAEPDFAVPAFVQQFGQERSLPGLMERLRQEVAKLAAVPLGKPGQRRQHPAAAGEDGEAEKAAGGDDG